MEFLIDFRGESFIFQFKIQDFCRNENITRVSEDIERLKGFTRKKAYIRQIKRVLKTFLIFTLVFLEMKLCLP